MRADMTRLKIAVIAAILASFTLAANPTSCAQNIAAQAEAIRKAAIAICGFEPEAASVALMLSPNSPNTISGVSQIAQAICAQVVPQKAAGRRGFARATVNGVVITGRFVN